MYVYVFVLLGCLGAICGVEVCFMSPPGPREQQKAKKRNGKGKRRESGTQEDGEKGGIVWLVVGSCWGVRVCVRMLVPFGRLTHSTCVMI